MDERPTTRSKPRTADRAATGVMLIVAIALLIPMLGASAAHRYPGSLTATPDVLHAGDTFTVSGCGYDRSLGNVIVGFTGGSWGSPLDANGCFSIPGIPALSGDTLAPGTYDVNAYQLVRKRWVETGETTVTVVK
jgi:hypothetical protein